MKYCKILAIGIICLFVGVAVASNININESSLSIESETVETTVKIYRTEGVTPHTVKLTEQKSDEVDRLFNNIQANLNSAETEEETDEIFNDAVVSLDELGLLPKDMTVEESQQLVTGMYQNPSVINPLGNLRGSNENFDCLVTGRVTEIHMFDLLYYILDTILWWIRNDVTWNSFNFPFFYGKIGYISFSWYEAEEWGDDRYHKSKGWVWTKGTNGTVTWNGELGGNLGAECVLDNRQLGLTVYVYMGIADFKGLWIDSFSRYTYFLGNAAHISLRYV